MSEQVEIQVACDECEEMFDTVYEKGVGRVECPSCGHWVGVDDLELECV